MECAALRADPQAAHNALPLTGFGRILRAMFNQVHNRSISLSPMPTVCFFFSSSSSVVFALLSTANILITPLKIDKMTVTWAASTNESSTVTYAPDSAPTHLRTVFATVTVFDGSANPDGIMILL